MNSQREIEKKILPVAARLRVNAALAAAGRGALLGAAAALAVTFLGAAAGGGFSFFLAMAAAVVIPAAMAAWAYLRSSSRRAAARLIDDRHNLHDRTLTAISAPSSPSAMQQLQMDDAQRRLAGLSTRGLVPLKVPRRLPLGIALSAAAVALALLPLSRVPEFVRTTAGEENAPPIRRNADMPVKNMPPAAARAGIRGVRAEGPTPEPLPPLERRAIQRRYFSGASNSSSSIP